MTERAEQFDDVDRVAGVSGGEPGGEIGDLHVATVVLNVQDMRRAVAFWSAALGYRPRESAWDGEFMMLVDPRRRGLPVSLQLTDRPPREPLRGHLDLYTREQQRHVDRLVALGASRVTGWTYPPDPDFVVLRDTEGNEFCVIDHDELGWGPASGDGDDGAGTLPAQDA